MTQHTFREFNFKVERIAAPLRQSVTESIRYAIAVGRFKSGERLPERELCELTGVSRTLVREALRQLESEGLVQVLPHRGPMVAKLTLDQAEGVYQVRMELEGLACELFAKRASEEQRQALKAAFQDLKKSLGDPHTDQLSRLYVKNRFYDCLIDGSGNEALGISLRMLNARVMLLRATSMRVPGRATRSIAELAELLKTLMARDGKRARAAAVNHVRHAAEAAIALMTRNAEQEPPDRQEKKDTSARVSRNKRWGT
jgi:DNA-binding GntR family transcriptional regulator